MMSLAHATDTATIWLANGIPARMVWRGERWRVTDTPTEPEGFYWSTHLPPAVSWRFQGTNAAGDTHVFDVVQGPEGWSVARVYD
jgi:hypothetical protein